MNKIIEKLLENNIPIRMEYNNETKQPEYVLNGFYKSGEVRLSEVDDKLIALARYNEKTEIYELRDLVALNYKWWNNYKDRYEGWKNPECHWIPLLEKYGFITKKVETITSWS